MHNLINCLKGRHLSRLKASSLNIFTNLGVWSGNKMILLDLWGRRSSISTRAGQGQAALWVMSASDCYKKDECIKWKFCCPSSNNVISEQCFTVCGPLLHIIPSFSLPLFPVNLSNAGIQASKIYTSMSENGTRSSKKLTLGTQDYCPPMRKVWVET